MIINMSYKKLAESYLETLTNSELIKMADNLGIDIPPGLDRIFIIRELLEADADLTPDNSVFSQGALINDVSLIEPVPLPKQYNINYIEILLRDSLWAFVYWEIKSHDQESFELDPAFEGYFLNVVSLARKDSKMIDEPFRISVDGADKSWRIYIQPHIALFRVDLCVKKGESEEIIISSKDIRVPGVFDPLDESLKELPEYPVLVLSGIEDFQVLRNVDRVSRMRRLCKD